MASTYWEKKIKKKKLFQKKKEIFLVNFGDCNTGLRPWTDFIYVNDFWSCYVINRGKDVSAGNKNQCFTHVLESTFESMEGVVEYIAHPTHVDMQRCSCLMWRSTWWLTTNPLRFILDWKGDRSHLKSYHHIWIKMQNWWWWIYLNLCIFQSML